MSERVVASTVRILFDVQEDETTQPSFIYIVIEIIDTELSTGRWKGSDESVVGAKRCGLPSSLLLLLSSGLLPYFIALPRSTSVIFGLSFGGKAIDRGLLHETN